MAAAVSEMRAALVQRLKRWRYVIQAAVDVAAWGVALTFATYARYDFNVSRVDVVDLALMVPLAGLLQMLAGTYVGLYVGRWRYGSFDEVAALGRAAGLTTIAAFIFDVWILPKRLVPMSAALGGGIAALVLMAGARYGWRLLLESRRRPQDDGRSRLIVFGAGEGGVQVLTAMMRAPGSPFLPVALLDDDRAKRNLRISGVRVMGTRYSIADVAKLQRADTVLIAIPSASAELVRELTELAEVADLKVKVLPPVSELFGEGVGVADIRDITPADLLGRHEIETDLASIAGYVMGKRVLVTGAGGSIGSELCRQLVQFSPAALLMLDRDESALHAVQLSIEGRAMLDTPNLILCDIRDDALVREVFAERKPQVVFHAAALKHLPLLERYPAEAVKTNVLGTLTVLEAAAANGVERFVNISTDKAADPISVLGYSKRIAERLTAHFAETAEGTFISVRFGNVLGSRGSMLGAFQAQIEAGGPITVTHPDVTRYFMTVHEAVELVVQAGAIGRDGEALVLDMGKPVRIADVAERMAAQAQRDISIIYTGLRPGEKLHEVLLGEDEPDERPLHPLISHVSAGALHPRMVRPFSVLVDSLDIRTGIADLCRSSTVDY